VRIADSTDKPIILYLLDSRLCGVEISVESWTLRAKARMLQWIKEAGGKRRIGRIN